MISYMPLDDQSILAPNLKNNKLHNLSKNHSIEILPNSTYPFKHGFYFQKYLNQRYFIQLDNELSEKLELEGDVEYENLNNKTINIKNLTSDLIVINPFQTILYVSSEKIELDPVVEQVVESVAEPEVVEPVAEPEVVEQVVEPVAEPEVVEPVAEPEVVEQVVEPVTEPNVVEQVVEPVTEPNVVEQVAEPEVVEQVVEPVTEPKVAEPVAEPEVEPEVVEQVAEPVVAPKKKYVRKKKTTT